MKTFIPLEESSIRRALANQGAKRELHFHLYSEIDSTNQYLKELPRTPQIQICCAEKQSRGRGRFDRLWVSPFGENITLSLRLTLAVELRKLAGLSLVVSLAILDALQEINNTLWIKWPNDLLWQDKKLCGVLIENLDSLDGFSDLIIGIGLNVNMDPLKNMAVDRPIASLYGITGLQFDRNILIARLLDTLLNQLDQFLANGFAPFQKAWQKVDYLQGREICVKQAQTILQGVANGVTNQGLLRLKDIHGQEYHLASGESTLRSIRTVDWLL